MTAHEFQLTQSMLGYSWACPCGEGGETQYRDQDDARSEAYAHVRQARGLDDSIVPTDEECITLLARVIETGRAVDDTDLTDGLPYAAVMAVLDVLERRSWIAVDKPLRGDDRLMAARGIRATALG